MPMTLNHWDICRPAQPICILLEYTGEEHEDKYYEDKQSNAIIRYITRVVNIMMKQLLLISGFLPQCFFILSGRGRWMHNLSMFFFSGLILFSSCHRQVLISAY
uniref:GST N-terminal domain-containing protein n=1 Tax=Astatotilapia calliptera TaxID=8154 RepID=A0A3P8RG72_ASTCA